MKQRKEEVLVAVRCDDGPAIFTFPTRAQAEAFTEEIPKRIEWAITVDTHEKGGPVSRRQPKFITAKLLKRLDACHEEVQAFEETWPDGERVAVTKENVFKALEGGTSGLALIWLSVVFFPDKTEEAFTRSRWRFHTRWSKELRRLLNRDKRRPRKVRTHNGLSQKFLDEQKELKTKMYRSLARIFVRYWERAIEERKGAK